MHAIEHVGGSYGAAYGVSAGVNVEDMLLEEAKKSMKEEMAFRLSVPSERQIIEVGPAKFLILDQAGKPGN